MKIKLLSLQILTVFVVTNISYAQQKLTLTEAFQKALMNNEEIQTESLKVGNAELTSNNAFNNRLPSVKVSGRYSRVSEVDPFKIQLNPSMTPIEIVSPIENQYAMKATLTQSLFTGFKLENANEAMNNLYESSKKELETKKNDVVLKVAQAYFNVIASEKVLLVLNKNYEQLDKRVKDAEQMKLQGLLTENDVLKIKVKLNEVEVSKIQAENNLKITQMNLNLLLGDDVETSYQLEMPISSEISSGKSERPELSSLNYKLEAQKSVVNASYGDWYPSIFLQANYDYARPNSRIFPQKDEWKPTWDINLILSFDIWNWGTSNNNIQIAKNNLQALELGKSQIEKAFTTEEKIAVYAVDKSSRSVKVLEKQVEQSLLNLKISENQYQAGLLSTTDLLDAQIQTLQSDIQLIQMQLELKMNELKLQKSRGVLKY